MFKTSITSPPPLSINREDLRSAVQRAGEEALRAVKNGWPVDTGASKDSFKMTVIEGRGDIRIAITSDSTYTTYINSGRAISEARARSEAAIAGLEDEIADLLLSQLR